MTQPLAGRTVLVTRPAHQAAALAQAIRAAGGTAFEFPALEVEAASLDELSVPLARLAEANIAIFISPMRQFGMAAIHQAAVCQPRRGVYGCWHGARSRRAASAASSRRTARQRHCLFPATAGWRASG
jgi:uroporphyrinogen-III synthase